MSKYYPYGLNNCTKCRQLACNRTSAAFSPACRVAIRALPHGRNVPGDFRPHHARCCLGQSNLSLEAHEVKVIIVSGAITGFTLVMAPVASVTTT
ncbi:hypothetical protein PI124_g2583 [Phytophthora idaei]|nr:hypothetical protein PI126_g12561 [Phytophthora idaei]KAG3252832.1 hypothetical protein PI124_g2583 [Phytophthora idaei]